MTAICSAGKVADGRLALTLGEGVVAMVVHGADKII